MIKLLLVDDHKIILDGLTALFSTMDEFVVIATANSGEEARDKLKHLKVDVIIMDIIMPGSLNGVQATKLIKKEYPHIKVLALSILGDPSSIVSMFSAGADGYLVKNIGSNELKFAIENVLNHSIYIHPDLMQVFINNYLNGTLKKDFLITEKEHEVLQLIADGQSTKEIAKMLFRSEETIKTHRKNLLKKFDCPNAAALVKFAFQHHLLFE